MMSVPKWLTIGISWSLAAFTFASAGILLAAGRLSVGAIATLLVFAIAFTLCLTPKADAPLSVWRTVVATGVGAVVPWFGFSQLAPEMDSYTSGAWFLGVAATLTVELLWRRRAAGAWIVAGALVISTYAWGGIDALMSFAVVAAVLFMAAVVAGGAAVGQTYRELERYASAERETLNWRAAQDAYQTERTARLAATDRLAAPLLRRIVDAGGSLVEEDRLECRVLEQTIRDEIRGRRLLNDAVREQVLAHRRRGAVVQVNDDGGMDELDAAVVEPLLQQVAVALRGLSSDRIIVRTAPHDSGKALSIVAMSIDPVAAALGLDDEEEHVDLWLELDRPVSA